ncbi:hypothetical protein TSAR_012442 [Trichomalopsis sarcophagae]|uniref:Uncharacterized protein n=1 Tax=Trichomalopsis sarcophagae TaxID=543379 RepID=A0A232EL43_9HYME|nr:hypothetical protein TSAR_012442 [Trichomalopsis sarcophagae]
MQKNVLDKSCRGQRGSTFGINNFDLELVFEGRPTFDSRFKKTQNHFDLDITLRTKFKVKVIATRK